MSCDRGIRIGRALAGLIVIFAGGCRCQSGMKAFDVHVTPHLAPVGDATSAAPVEVNVVGVNDADYEKWIGYPLSRYWSPRDPLRTGAKAYVMSFSHDNQETAVLQKDNPIWDTWNQQGATHLFVIAFLPMVKDQGGQDLRRAELPLDRCLWKRTSQLEFQLLDDRVVSVSQP